MDLTDPEVEQFLAARRKARVGADSAFENVVRGIQHPEDTRLLQQVAADFRGAAKELYDLFGELPGGKSVQMYVLGYEVSDLSLVDGVGLEHLKEWYACRGLCFRLAGVEVPAPIDELDDFRSQFSELIERVARLISPLARSWRILDLGPGQRSVPRRTGLVVNAGKDVAAGVHGHRDIGVPEDLHDRPRVDPLSQ